MKLKNSKQISIEDLIMQYFFVNPKKELPHGPVVDWVEEQYKKLYGRKPIDTWRGIRKLYQRGMLIKVKKEIYQYDPGWFREFYLSFGRRFSINVGAPTE